MLDWQRLIRGTSSNEVETTQRTRQQINLDTALQASRATTRTVSFPQPDQVEVRASGKPMVVLS